MLRIFKKAGATPKVSTDKQPKLDSILGKYSSQLKQINDLLLDNNAVSLFNASIRRYLNFVWYLPASAQHHLNVEFGLFEHSLNVSIIQLQDFEKQLFFEKSSRFDEEVDALKTQVMRPKWQYAYCLFGIFHDIGKVCNYLVYAGEDKSIQWNPFSQGLYDFMIAHKGRINYKALRDRSYALHKKLAPALIMRVLSVQDVLFLTVDVFGELIDGLSHYTHQSCPFYQVKTKSKKNADMRATESEISDPEKSTSISEQAVVDTLKDIFQSGDRQFNTTMGPFWVLQDYIAVNISLFYEVVKKLRNDGVNLPTDNRILAFLSNRKYVEPVEPGSSMCIHNVVVSSDKNGKIGRLELKVLLFKKELLTDRKLPIYQGYFSINK